MKNKLATLIGKHIIVYCVNYIYAGKLSAVDGDTLTLTSAQIVYETGALNAKTFNTAEDIPSPEWNIFFTAIESFGVITR